MAGKFMREAVHGPRIGGERNRVRSLQAGPRQISYFDAKKL